jgi:hypothetical protein
MSEIIRHRIFTRSMANIAIYGEHEAFIAIQSDEIIEGHLPKAAARLVKEWALVRQDQLSENWRRARAGEQPERIAGLDVD